MTECLYSEWQSLGCKSHNVDLQPLMYNSFISVCVVPCTWRMEVMFHLQQSYFQHKGLSSGILLAWAYFLLYIRFHVILEISASFFPHVQVMAVQRWLLILPASSKNSFQQLMCHHPVCLQDSVLHRESQP